MTTPVLVAVAWPYASGSRHLGHLAGTYLPDDISANQYVTFKGGKASARRGIGLTIDEGLERFQPDAFRYAPAAAFPEQAGTEISEEQIGPELEVGRPIDKPTPLFQKIDVDADTE